MKTVWGGARQGHPVVEKDGQLFTAEYQLNERQREKLIKEKGKNQKTGIIFFGVIFILITIVKIIFSLPILITFQGFVVFILVLIIVHHRSKILKLKKNKVKCYLGILEDKKIIKELAYDTENSHRDYCYYCISGTWIEISSGNYDKANIGSQVVAIKLGKLNGWEVYPLSLLDS